MSDDVVEIKVASLSSETPHDVRGPAEWPITRGQFSIAIGVLRSGIPQSPTPRVPLAAAFGGFTEEGRDALARILRRAIERNRAGGAQ